jgi:hypothetical protein
MSLANVHNIWYPNGAYLAQLGVSMTRDFIVDFVWNAVTHSDQFDLNTVLSRLAAPKYWYQHNFCPRVSTGYNKIRM